MDSLSRLLSSRVKAEIFRLLFGLGTPEMHLREIARRAGLNDATVRQELRRLTALGLVKIRRDGNRSYACAYRHHPLYPELHGLVLKTSGLAEVLRDALGTAGILAAFIFGSIASGSEQPGSDVDLMVIGDISLFQLSARLSGLTEKVSREINPHVFQVNEFSERRRSKDHFITTVLAAPKIFIIGDENELARLGQ
jgi:predicted nucleotidyltransferase